MKNGMCQFCKRENISITNHHLIPRISHSKKKIRRMNKDLNETVSACRLCHNHIHATYSEKELAEKYNKVSLLLSQEVISKFTNWVKDKPNDLRIHNNMSNRRRMK